MHLNTVLFLSLFSIVFAAPTPASSSAVAAAASAKNVYLSTCTTRSLLTDEVSSSAILFSGPAASTQPTDIGTISPLNAIPWAGATRRARLESGIFESKIAAGADALAKSEIAGTARLNRGEVIEEFVCFRDGGSTFRFAAGVLGEGQETSVCVAEYWCGSIGV
jgi:hypothetical protein